jgi:NAD(P)H-dependent flavin oxidoreductase YrpB (nitropropane dioxygenase family)
MNDASGLQAIIQGGMGVGVSNWRLANAVSSEGQLGVVSGTALDAVLARRLQDGDIGGHMRRAMDAFPIREMVDTVLERYFKPEGRAEGEPYAMVPMFRRGANKFRDGLTALSNFVEVWLAKEGHNNEVGINYLTKIQMPTLPSIYGAMMAGVDYILMGAGIPRDIPGVLDLFAEGKSAELKLEMDGTPDPSKDVLRFDPAEMGAGQPLKRPKFLPIIASNSLATMMVRKANGRVDGFIIEGPTAGGHNAPPRGKKVYNDKGEPLYGDRDVVDLEQVAELGLPFWVAGGAGHPGAIEKVRESGGTGIQVGTLFAYCEESGISDEYKQAVLRRSVSESIEVRTDDKASPTGFPFKTVDLSESISEDAVYEARTRVCDLGYLRTAFRGESGRLDYRCASEPIADYTRKGGTEEAAEGRRCLCNSLMSNIGHAQVREDGTEEAPLLTSGDDLSVISKFLGGRTRYTARDVIDYLLS